MGCFGSKNKAILPDSQQRHRKLSKHSSLDLELSDEIFIPFESIFHLDVQELYQIQTTIAKGKYGTVYLATNNITHQQVAVKIQIRENQAAILSELQITKKLDHPNIIKCLETFQDSKFLYIVTEFCSGGELIKHSSSFSELYTKEIIYKLLLAVNHMHSNNIVHRDLKPENVLIDSSGEMKIIDFGLSKIISGEGKFTDIVGTPLYMAPEITNGSYGAECDLWSIGIIMHYMLLGSPPDLGDSKAEIMKNLKSGKIGIDLSSDKWVFGKEAKDLMERLLCKNPQKRIGCREALGHGWFRGGKRESRVPKEVVDKVRCMESISRGQFLVLSVAVVGLEKGEINEAKKWFQILDRENVGIVKVSGGGIDVQLGYSDFLICILRETIIKKIVPQIYQWCVRDGYFSTEVLRSILCRKGNYVSFSLFADKFVSLEDFQRFLL